jgi:hypothetical protein
MQVLDNARWPARDKKQLAGACYDLYAPSKPMVKPAGEWNQARLNVDGNKVEHWLNGEKIVAYEIGSEDWKARVAAIKFKNMPLFAKASKGRICIQDPSDRGSTGTSRSARFPPGNPDGQRQPAQGQRGAEARDVARQGLGEHGPGHRPRISPRSLLMKPR